MSVKREGVPRGGSSGRWSVRESGVGALLNTLLHIFTGGVLSVLPELDVMNARIKANSGNLSFLYTPCAPLMM